MPGIMPLLAISRKQRRESLNFLKNPRARPVSWQRLRRRTGEELRGNLLRAILASCLSSSLLFISRMIFFKRCRFSHLRFTSFSRLFCFAIEDLVAILSHYFFLSAGPFCRCLRLGSVLLMT